MLRRWRCDVSQPVVAFQQLMGNCIQGVPDSQMQWLDCTSSSRCRGHVLFAALAVCFLPAFAVGGRYMVDHCYWILEWQYFRFMSAPLHMCEMTFIRYQSEHCVVFPDNQLLRYERSLQESAKARGVRANLLYPIGTHSARTRSALALGLTSALKFSPPSLHYTTARACDIPGFGKCTRHV
jgi:hypothetical protein